MAIVGMSTTVTIGSLAWDEDTPPPARQPEMAIGNSNAAAIFESTPIDYSTHVLLLVVGKSTPRPTLEDSTQLNISNYFGILTNRLLS
jgi:hypothetical protein